MDPCYCTGIRQYCDHALAGTALTAAKGADCFRQLINTLVPSMFTELSPKSGSTVPVAERTAAVAVDVTVTTEPKKDV